MSAGAQFRDDIGAQNLVSVPGGPRVIPILHSVQIEINEIDEINLTESD